MDIIFNPPDNVENRYIRILVEELRARGYRIHPLATFFSGYRHFRSIRLVHLNWFENIDESGFFMALRSFVRKLTVLAAIRLGRKPLVWTMHNRASHEKGMAWFSRVITRLLIRWSDVIVIHSGQSEDVLAGYGPKVLERVAYVPHPHFIGVYGDAFTCPPPSSDALQLLFIGMVKPYKNLELLIDVANTFGHDVQLTIAGKAVDDGYRQQLAKRVAGMEWVTLLPYFIPDGELVQLLGQADAVVLPYDLASSLNSGTAMLAFSYKKTVICPAIGTITDLGEYMADTFCYRYDTAGQHREALKQQMEQALLWKRRDPHALSDRGERLCQHVAAANDPQRIGDELVRLYRHVIEGRRRDGGYRHNKKDG